MLIRSKIYGRTDFAGSCVWIALIFFTALACHKDDDATAEDDLWVYADRFFDEAVAHNVSLDKSSLTIRFVEATEIAPYAGYGTTNPPLVRIVQTFWETYTPVQKEQLMFHELGHAMLGRFHTNEKLPNCFYKSMMIDGDLFNIYSDTSIAAKRDYYLDELFNPSTPTPSWGGTIGPNEHEIFNGMHGAGFHPVNTSAHKGNIEDDGSLHIQGIETEQGEVSFWLLDIPTESITERSSVVLHIKIKTTNVTGKGVWVNLQADVNEDKYFNTSTLNYGTVVKNMDDFNEFTLVLNCYPTEKPNLYVYLFMDGSSTGDVIFKDLQVLYYN